MTRGSEGGGRARAARRWRLVVAGVALVALGSGAHQLAISLPEATVRVVGGNHPIGATAGEVASIDANNSPSLARNPLDVRNLVVANRVDSPSFSCALHTSSDGGATWQRIEIPFPEGEELPPRCFAPDVAFGPDGVLYLSFVTLRGAGNTPSAAWVVTSHDGGTTLDTPSRVLGELAFQVRIAVDPSTPRRVYLAWLQAREVGLYQFPSAGNPILLRRSDDGGRTWGPPVRVSRGSRQRVIAPSLAASAGDDVYVLFLDLRDDRLDYHGGHAGRGGEPYPGRWSLVLARSRDGGRSWAESVVDPGIVPVERVLVFLPPMPSLAVHPASGRVHASFHDGRLGDADVWVWTSRDGGATFGPARRVNDTRRRDRTSQYLPRLAVAPNGRLDVLYYDRRTDEADLLNEVSLQSSFDGGRTFGRRVRVSDRPFSSRIGFGSERDLPDLGSRLALEVSDARALAVWTDTRAGSVASNKQDLARAVVSFTAGSGARQPLRIAGLAGAAAGAALALVGLAWRRRPRNALTGGAAPSPRSGG